jgi:hypothetical protein
VKFLLDEMYPAEAAELLRDRYGHDAVHVRDIGLGGIDDADVADFARREQGAMVAENVADFSAEEDVVLVFVPKRRLPAGGAQAAALAELLDRRAKDDPKYRTSCQSCSVEEEIC